MSTQQIAFGKLGEKIQLEVVSIDNIVKNFEIGANEGLEAKIQKNDGNLDQRLMISYGDELLGYVAKSKKEESSLLISELLEKVVEENGSKVPKIVNLTIKDIKPDSERMSLSTQRIYLEGELVNSIHFEQKQENTSVTINTSAVMFKGSSVVLSEINNELESTGSVRVTAYMNNDKIIAKYREKDFGMVSAADESDLDFVKTIIEKKGLANLSIKERSGKSYIASVLNEKTLKLLSAKEEIENEKNRILSEGILSEEELNKRLTYMKSLRKNQIAEILKMIVEVPAIVKHRITPEPEILYQDVDNLFGFVVDGILVNDSILLKGPKSTGKNTIIETASWLCYKPYAEIILSKTTTEEKIFGQTALVVDEDGHQITQYKPTEVTLVLENGGFVVFDELNAGISTALTSINSLADGRQRVDIPNFRMVTRHENSRIFGTMNPGYIGVAPVNQAVADRFNTTLYVENGLNLLKLYKTIYGEDLLEDKAIALSEIYSKFFDMVNDEDEESDDAVLTIRGFLSAYKKIAIGQDFVSAVEVSIINKVEDRDIREGLKEVIMDNFGNIK